MYAYVYLHVYQGRIIIICCLFIVIIIKISLLLYIYARISGEDHWILRSTAAQVVASACRKYSILFPDLQARVCKTYVDALILSLNTTSKGSYCVHMYMLNYILFEV
jgi:hypothetical protein